MEAEVSRNIKMKPLSINALQGYAMAQLRMRGYSMTGL